MCRCSRFRIFPNLIFQPMPALILLWVLALAVASWAGPAAKTKPQSTDLDTTRIHALYMDGDFDRAIAELEKARKQGRLRTHADSVFAFKHLGVMYAATYATVEKGKQNMVQLLTIEPTVSILDMYASDMIYMIFRNVQAEVVHARPFHESRMRFRRSATQWPPSRGSDPAGVNGPIGQRALWLWLSVRAPSCISPFPMPNPGTATIMRES